VIFYWNPEERSQRKEVIDGQQRQITTAIFAAALRDYFLEESKAAEDAAKQGRLLDLGKGIQTLYIGRQPALGTPGQFEYYLETGISTHTFFRQHIQKMNISFMGNQEKEIHVPVSGSEEEKLIAKAYHFFKKQIEIYSGANPEKALELHHNLTRHILIRIEVADLDVANEIFESVNDKGLSLGVSDLVKNQVLRHFDPNSTEEDAALKKWIEMTSNIEDGNLKPKEFLRYYWSSKYSYVPDKKLYKTIKQEFGSSEQRWRSLVGELESESEALSNLFTWTREDCRSFLGHTSPGNKFHHSLQVFRASSSKTWVVFLLSLMRNHDKLKANDLSLVAHLRNFHRFLFFYFDLLGMPGNWFFSLMCEAAGKIERATSGDDLNACFDHLYGQFLSRLEVSEELFLSNFGDLKYANADKTRSQLTYILSEYERYLRGTGTEEWDEDKVSIEHFLPQKPKNWNLKDKDVKGFVHRIGNLVLIPNALNGSLGNKSCAEKLTAIGQSASQMYQLRELVEKVEADVWNFRAIADSDFKAIEDRGAHIGRAAYEIWVVQLKADILASMGA
jgi:hypothetical protein